MQWKKSEFEERCVFLYGAGNLGKKLFRFFKEQGIFVEGFIDRRAKVLQKDLSCIVSLEDPLLDFYAEHSLIVLSGLFGCTQEEMIREELENRGFHNICALREIEWKSFETQGFLKHLFIGDFNTAQLEKQEIQNRIQEALQLFPKGAEHDYIRSYIDAHRRTAYEIFPMPLPLEEQYLAKGLGERLDLGCFVDAGAFDGDVLRRFLEGGWEVGTYIAFEPQLELCHRIFETASRYSQIRNAMVFPCGLSDTWETIGFSVDLDGMSAAKADKEGTGSISCLPLDEALIGVQPTFLKMDIEGMEMKALHGAAKTIRACHPQLAICVYHELSHIWEIPLYIKSLYEGYRFHIRNYQYMGLETVVYAFP